MNHPGPQENADLEGSGDDDRKEIALLSGCRCHPQPGSFSGTDSVRAAAGPGCFAAVHGPCL